ncbi:MAG: hypothetical protein J7527_03230, partial [Chitinophagaceae bacterium]|nr:hypothetical protein [Chitinophagaceae bacterium]
MSSLGIKTVFDTRNDCVAYMNELSPMLQMRGYVTASVDSVFFDSAFARAVIYIGDRYEWGKLDASQVD